MSTLSEFRTIINAEIRTSVASTVMQEAKVTEDTMNKIVNNMAIIKDKEVTLHDNLRVGIRAISTLQLLRFAMKDIQDIASGKGGIQDVLSLATSSMIIISNVNDLLRQQIVLETALNAIMLIGATIAAINPVTLGLALAAIAVVGTQAAVGAYTGYQQAQREPELSSQRMRTLAYRSIVGQ